MRSLTLPHVDEPPDVGQPVKSGFAMRNQEAVAAVAGRVVIERRAITSQHEWHKSSLRQISKYISNIEDSINI